MRKRGRVQDDVVEGQGSTKLLGEYLVAPEYDVAFAFEQRRKASDRCALLSRLPFLLSCRLRNRRGLINVHGVRVCASCRRSGDGRRRDNGAVSRRRQCLRVENGRCGNAPCGIARCASIDDRMSMRAKGYNPVSVRWTERAMYRGRTFDAHRSCRARYEDGVALLAQCPLDRRIPDTQNLRMTQASLAEATYILTIAFWPTMRIEPT